MIQLKFKNEQDEEEFLAQIEMDISMGDLENEIEVTQIK